MTQVELEILLKYLNFANLMYQDEINLANKYNYLKEYLKLKNSILKKVLFLYNFCLKKIIKKMLFNERENYINENMANVLESTKN